LRADVGDEQVSVQNEIRCHRKISSICGEGGGEEVGGKWIEERQQTEKKKLKWISKGKCKLRKKARGKANQYKVEMGGIGVALYTGK